MTILFATGFEVGNNLANHPDITISGASINGSSHTGAYSLRAAQTNYMYYNFPVTQSEIYYGVWVTSNSGTRTRLFVYMVDNTSIEVRHYGYSVVELYIDGSLVASGNTLFDTAWHNFQVHIILDDSNGLVEVKIDGSLEISYSGDTQPGTAPNNIDRFRLYCDVASYAYFDDLIIADSSHGWPGDVRIDYLTPTSDATAEWTPSTGGDNYALVDEVPPGTGDYVSSTVNGDLDLYGLSDWDNTNKTPVAVNLWHYGNSDVGSQYIKQTINSNGTPAQSSDKELTVANLYQNEIFETDPDTGLAWTDTGIDALEAGQESVI